LRQSCRSSPASAIFWTSSGSASATRSAGSPSMTARACLQGCVERAQGLCACGVVWSAPSA
jgi:hypothetical protein